MPELDRRDFLKLVGMGTGAAATAGCSDPVEKLIPYVIQPEEITPGLPTYYASTCEECSLKCGLHVKTREGRPIKLEGNPDHPINKGKLCARGQAGIGRTYSPDRYAGPMVQAEGGMTPISWEEAQGQLSAALRNARGRTVILGASRGPTVDGIIDAVAKGVGATRVVYETFGDETLRAATQSVFGVNALPVFDLSQADLVVDVGSDFIDASPVELAGQFAEAQSIGAHKDGGARLVSLSPRLSLTAGNADIWIPVAAGAELDVIRAVGALAIAKRGGSAGALAGVNIAAAASRAGIDRAKLDDLAARLAAAKNPVVLPPGVALTGSSGTATASAVLLLNAALGAVGHGVKIPAESDTHAPDSMAEVAKIVGAMKAGAVDVLIVHDANPLYSLPEALGFAEALQRVKLVVSTASLKDETAEAANLVLPDHTSLERWADAAPRSGVRSIVQPTVRPLHDTKALGDTLLECARGAGAQVPAGTTHEILKANWGAGFRAALAAGGRFGGAKLGGAQARSGGLDFRAPALQGSGEYTLVAYPHSFLGDGSSACLGWMQEIPDPVGKTSWNSWAEISNATAEKLGVVYGDVIKIETGFGAGSIEVPCYPRGGIRDDTVAVAIGQGHTVGLYASREYDDEPGVARGANVISVLPASTDPQGGRVWLGAKASLSKTGRFQRVALSQWTDDQYGRGLAPEISLAVLNGEAEEHHEGHAIVQEFTPSQDASPESPYRWGMTIDNDRCNGCSACISACYIENNVPVVGEAQALMHREMTWLRIERYLGDGDKEGGNRRRPIPDGEKLGEVNVRHVPMLCQHCGAAPCESVCPVIATYHTPEGVNGMVYNRCVGTRYCANNCTYKVRRFNYWDYGQFNFPGLLNLMLNPDVTVRGQGVMEKCTFCYQRIAAARQTAKDEGRDIADGEVVTACQQSCPTNAITFGNTRDPESAVAKKAEDEKRAYYSLLPLNTRPAITYLKQVGREASADAHHGSDHGESHA